MAAENFSGTKLIIKGKGKREKAKVKLPGSGYRNRPMK
jgi:hypothetical protein